MTMKLLATDILDVLIKADSAGVNYRISRDVGDYVIKFTMKYDKTKCLEDTVVITKESESDWNCTVYPLCKLIDFLDELLEKQKQDRIKAEKRRDLITSLTEEQRELLGVSL